MRALIGPQAKPAAEKPSPPTEFARVTPTPPVDVPPPEEPVEPPTLIDHVRYRLDKRRQEARLRNRKRQKDEPTGEELSALLLKVSAIPLDNIALDPDFQNTRLIDHDPITNGHSLEDLRESMRSEGLKVPITVADGPKRGTYYLKVGFRRVKAARQLGWKTIPAIVWPKDLPQELEYWANIIENTARKPLTGYELACAAKMMRDKFEIKASDFARKSGYSYSYISMLLSCIDKLPELLLEHWRNGTRLTIDQWYKLSLCEPDVAMAMFHRWANLRPKDIRKALEDQLGNRKEKSKKQFPSAYWLTRMQRLYIGLEASNAITLRERDLMLKVIEYCMGQRDTVPGIYDPKRQKDYERLHRLKAELHLPDPPDPGDLPSDSDSDAGAPFSLEDIKRH